MNFGDWQALAKTGESPPTNQSAGCENRAELEVGEVDVVTPHR
jgi:hypothetical protein